ncbi:CTCF [Haematobia irritans]|uniref:CTCF n=1 Tax=Haematobia irritans TaxID=7368 RepID=UPI003F4F401B
MAADSDLESYLENIDKEIEEVEFISLSPKKIKQGQKTETVDHDDDDVDEEEAEGEDAPANANDDDILDDVELEDGTIFMDADGNYYYQSGKKAIQVKPVTKAKPIAKVTDVVKRKRKELSSPPKSPKKQKTQTKSNNVDKNPETPSKKDLPKKSDGPSKTPRNLKNQSTITKFLQPKKTDSSIKSTKSAKQNPDTSKVKIESVEEFINIPKNRSTKNKSNITTTSSIDQTFNSDVENDEQVYELDETEKNVDDPDFTIDEKDAHLVKTKGFVKPIAPNADGEYKCPTCDYSSPKKFLLTRHLNTHNETRPFKCSVCERGFKTNVSLINHINTHLGNKPYKCEDCEMSFTTSGELTRHRRYRHTGIKPHKCTECDYSSVELSKLRRHIRCHTGERPYQCPHCTYASPDTFKLKRHMRTHTGEKPYECDICHARFTQSNSLKYHRLIHSVNDKPVFQCHLCPTTCGRKNDLRLHIQKLHNTDNPVTCKRCGKECPDRYSYKMHVKTHEGEKCFRCTYCPYASISQRHLDTHMLIHTDSKPFVCELCQQSFRQKQLLSRHMKIYHTENYEPPKPLKKAHACPHCDRSFAFKGNLIRHMEIHDPNSSINEEKLRLKFGRMKKLNSDGTVINETENYVYEEHELGEMIEDGEDRGEEEYGEENEEYIYEEVDDEDYEGEIEYYGEEEEEEKPIVSYQMENNDSADTPSRKGTATSKPSSSSQYKTVLVKAEEDGTELMDVTEDDNQDYMVFELLPEGDDHDTEEQPQNIEFIEKKPKRSERNTSQTQTALKAITEDCFGFDDDAEADEDDDDVESLEYTEILEK